MDRCLARVFVLLTLGNDCEKHPRPNGNLSLVQSKKNASSGYWNYASSFTYNAAGAVTSMQLGNGRWESTQFNSRLQPTQIALGTTQSATNLLDLDYTYGTTDENNGNVMGQTITVPTVGANTGFTAVQAYNYDSLNRLKDATENITPHGGSQTQSWKQTFLFDRYGNRNFDEANTTFAGFDKLCNSNTELCADLRKRLNPSINVSNNRLNTSEDYTFDNSGNTTSDPDERTFIYDAENKQVKVLDDQDDPIGEYWYDGDGRRVKKYVPSTGETTVFVYDAAGKLIEEYSTIVAATNDAKVAYLTNDHLGSPRINTDANGAVTARHDYHPFGEEIATSQRTTGLGYADDTVRKQFTGYERDQETDLDFAQARYFSSGFGRFSSPDDFLNDTHVSDPQSWNLYVYARSSPLRFIDPDGRIKRDPDTGKIIFHPKSTDTRQYGTVEATLKDGRKVTYTFTGAVNVGNIYADDGTPIEAQQAAGPLQVSVVDENGKQLYSGSVDELTKGTNSPFSGMTNKTNCHGATFADGEYWINDNQVEAIINGDGYMENTSETPARGTIGIFSTDGTLKGTQHSVTVDDPGAFEVTDPAPKRGNDQTEPGRPMLVDSKAGINVRQTVAVADSWTNTGMGRENHKLKFFSKKVNQ